MTKKFNSVGFVWVNREGNKAADLVANLALKNLLNRNWVMNPPPSLVAVLEFDRSACEEERSNGVQ